jgi:hypothetical protein
MTLFFYFITLVLQAGQAAKFKPPLQPVGFDLSVLVDMRNKHGLSA